MNVDRIIQMVINTVMRQVLHRGINAGMDKVMGGKQNQQPQNPNSQHQEPQTRETQQKMRRMTRMFRNF